MLLMGSQSQCGRNLGRDRVWLLRDERVAVEWRQVQRAHNEAPSEVVVLLAVRKSSREECVGWPRRLRSTALRAARALLARNQNSTSTLVPQVTALHSTVLRAARALHACVCEQCMRAVGITCAHLSRRRRGGRSCAPCSRRGEPSEYDWHQHIQEGEAAHLLAHVRLDADAQRLVEGVDLEELALQRVGQQLHERVERERQEHEHVK